MMNYGMAAAMEGKGGELSSLPTLPVLELAMDWHGMGSGMHEKSGQLLAKR